MGKHGQLFSCILKGKAGPETEMTHVIHFSEVQLLNLSFMMAMQASIRKDPIAACYTFRLTADQAPIIANLRSEKIQILIANLAHESLFYPRHDLLQLLETPPGLIGPMAAVRAKCSDPPPFSPVDRRHGKQS
jgi:hypothetical protein